MGFLFGAILASLAQPIWPILGSVTGFLFGRRHTNLGWSFFALVWLGSTVLANAVPDMVAGHLGGAGGIYAYFIVTLIAFLLTRLFSRPTEADGE